MNGVPNWHVIGDWFDVCKCSVPCPCSWAQPPTFGDCEGVLAWHIREGQYGDVRLDGLNVVAISAFEGNVWGEHTNAVMGIFMDIRADEAQREALQMIFSGQAGGWPQTLSEIIGGEEMLGLEFVPIEFEVADDLAYWRAEIPDRVSARGEALSGPTTPPGTRVQAFNLPGSEVGPGAVSTWGRATASRAEAFGRSFDWAGRSSKHMAFDWSGPGAG